LILEQQGPICFGAITLFSEDSDNCLACASFSGCSKRVENNIKIVSRVRNFDHLKAEHMKLKHKRKLEQIAADSGTLKTQAPPVEKNVTQGTVTLAEGPSLQLRIEQKSILKALCGAGTLADLKASIAAGINPFPRSLTETWLLCELLVRGAATKHAVENIVKKVGGSTARCKAAPLALRVADLSSCQ